MAENNGAPIVKSRLLPLCNQKDSPLFQVFDIVVLDDEH